MSTVREILVQLILTTMIDRNVNNPRRYFSEPDIQRMADSLKAKGMLVPLRVMPGNNGRFTLISGETRLTGAERIGMTEVPCIVVEGLDEEGVLEDQIVDNGVRRSLRPSEEARAICRLKLLTGETSKAIAERLGRNPSEITTFEAILTLPEEMVAAIDEDKVPLTSGYHLAKLEDSAARWEIFGSILAGKLSRDQTIRACSDASGKEKKPRKPTPGKLVIKHKTGVEIVVKGGDIATIRTALGSASRRANAAEDLEQLEDGE